MEVLNDSIYNYPEYYDLVYGADWEAEFDFLSGCLEKYCSKSSKSLFEPACGTGRLIYRFARAGFLISGLDLNSKAVDFCNARLKANGLPESAFVRDMCAFELDQKADFAFNTINSFRHLKDEKLAEDHFRCMADSLNAEGVYVLGLHLTPTVGETLDSESWVAEAGNLQVNTQMHLSERNLAERYEHYFMCFDVYTPEKFFQIQDTFSFRTYTAENMEQLIDRTGVFQIDGVYDFAYDIAREITIDAATEDVVYVLRKT